VAAGVANENEHGKFASRIKSALDATKVKGKKLSDEAEWVFGRRAWRVLGVVALFAVVVALLLVFLNWYVAPTKPSDKKDLVLALAQILAGTALLSGLYFTWRTLQVNREGQITERFTRAIDQLGATHDDNSKNLELRLGGIYALERIAKESEEDHWSIMEVLTAYIRQHARQQPAEREQGLHPGPDIQAIMTVLGRRPRSLGHGETEPLDLHETNLSTVGLWDVNLSGAILWGADLSAANLSAANLKGAHLARADLSRAYLEGAYLEGADLNYAHLEGAILSRANLKGAKVTDEQLADAVSLEGATMPDGSKHS
jgi:hypothetical protein